METWLDIARANRRAAGSLHEGKYYRSAISRAYYAVYARVTHELASSGATMPEGKEAPTHKALGRMVQTHIQQPAYLSGKVAALYDMRRLADYVTSTQVDAGQARAALALMESIFRSL